MVKTSRKKSQSACNHGAMGVCLVALTFSTSTLADKLDDIYLTVATGKNFDSNIFRKPENQISDQILVSSLNLSINKDYSLQKFAFDYTFTDYNYNRLSTLDYTSKAYNGNFSWSLTPHLSGSIVVKQDQKLNDFSYLIANTNGNNRNIRTTESQIIKFEFNPRNTLSYYGGYTHNKSENSLDFNAQANFSANTIDLGIAYASGYDNTNIISLSAHKTDASYYDRELFNSNFNDTGYEEKLYNLDFSYALTNKSLLKGQFSNKERTYDHFYLRDYRVNIGYLSYSMQHTDKLESILKYERSVAPFETLTSTYYISDSYGYELQFSPSIKSVIKASYKIGENNFTGRDIFSILDRQDKQSSMQLGYSWAPNNNWQINISASRQHRNSNINSFDYDYTLSSVSVQLFL